MASFAVPLALSVEQSTPHDVTDASFTSTLSVPAASSSALLRSSDTETLMVAKLKVEGMTCTNCSAAVERVLHGLRGVRRANVALTLGEARVAYDSAFTDEAAILEAVEDAGYGARLLQDHTDRNRIRFRVEGMLCSSCSTKVENALKATPGIQEAAVSLVTHRAEVTFDPDIVGPRTILEVVEGIGYDATLDEDSEDDSGDDPAAADRRFWRRKFCWSVVFTVPVFLLGMVFIYIPGIKNMQHVHMFGFRLDQVLKFILTTPVQYVIGWQFHVWAVRSLRHGAANMYVLISLGTNAAYIYSVFAMIYYRVHPNPDPTFMAEDFFETSALLITFISLGRYLEAAAKGRTSRAIQQLTKLAPATALLLKLDDRGGVTDEQEVPIALVQRGDVLKVLPGARVPADGEVVVGSSYVDESMITGEPAPVAKRSGDPLISGTVNGNGVLQMEVSRTGQDTTLSQIVRMVEGAQLSKAPIQALGDRVSAYFVPTVALASFLVFVVWYSCGLTDSFPSDWVPKNSSHFIFALNFGIATLVIACPCAVGLATPTAVMVGTGVAAKHGILIKGADAMERAAKVRAVLFDKTGTLTEGHPAVVAVELFDPQVPLEEVLALAAAAESGSEHPLASAVLDHAAAVFGISDPSLSRPSASLAADRFNQGTRAASTSQVLAAAQGAPAKTSPAGTPRATGMWLRPVHGMEALPGRGVRGWVASELLPLAASDRSLTSSPARPPVQPKVLNPAPDGVRVLVGNRKLMAEHSIILPRSAVEYVRQQEGDGCTCMLIAGGDRLLAAVAVTDPVKEEAAGVVAAIEARGVACHMITGDNWVTARMIAHRLGIRHVIAEVLPAGKADAVRALQAGGTAVAMVGDGVNDSPALAQADVGIAIGTGTDIAIEAADYVLMSGNLHGVLTALDLSGAALRRIRLNYLWAFGYNTVMLPIAAGVLYAPVRLQLPPWVAGAAMALSSLSVVCSSLLLHSYKPPAPVLNSVVTDTS